MINQLFRKMIPNEMLIKILACYNLKSLSDSKIFTKHDLILHNTVKRLYEIRETLLQYYLPCKRHLYLNIIRPSHGLDSEYNY